MIKLSFADRVLSFFREIHPLERIPRAGFLLRGVTEPESVASHSHSLALLALLVLDELGGEYNREDVLTMALIHDLPEAKSMDIPMPYLSGEFRTVKEEMEQRVAGELLDGFSPRFKKLFADLRGRNSKEARLVMGLDKVQMMLKILNYEREGRGDLRDFWENAANFNDYGIETVRLLFERIRAEKKRMDRAVT